MKVDFLEDNDISIFRVQGDIDINTAPEIKVSLDRKMGDSDNKIVINLADVGYIDSSGLATLVEILKNLRARGGSLKITNVPVKVRGLFEITKLDKLFDLVSDEKEAVNAFRA